MAMFGDVTNAVDAEGYPIRRDWTADWNDERVVVYGHEIQEQGARFSGSANTAIGIDTGAYESGDVDGFRGLTALRWPEREIVSIPTAALDIVEGDAKHRALRRAEAAATTTRTLAPVDAPALQRGSLRVLADELVAVGAAGWVCGLDAVAAVRGSNVREVVVCADGDELAEIMARHDAIRLGEKYIVTIAGEDLAVCALGRGVDVEQHINSTEVSMGGVMISLWGDGSWELPGEIGLRRSARVALRDMPEAALQAIAASAALKVPLNRDVQFFLKGSHKTLSFDADAVTETLETVNALGAGDLGRFLAACGAHGLLPAVFNTPVSVADVKALSAETDPSARLATMQKWRLDS
jgi:hypothetical protein